MNFLSAEILTKLRNRTYFQPFTKTGETFKSQGAWRITLTNEGDENVYIIDGGGNRKIIPTVPSFFNVLLDGAPYITRDDEFTIEFVGGGINPLLIVAFDRLVTKKETNDYPLDNLLKALK